MGHTPSQPEYHAPAVASIDRLGGSSRIHTPSSTGQPNRPSSYGVISRAVTNAAVRADRDLRKNTIKDRVSIHERPKNVDARTEDGHWEGDLIICERTRPVLVLHERKSRVTLAARLAGKTAAETISVMLAVFARIEPALRK